MNELIQEWTFVENGGSNSESGPGINESEDAHARTTDTSIVMKLRWARAMLRIEENHISRLGDSISGLPCILPNFQRLVRLSPLHQSGHG